MAASPELFTASASEDSGPLIVNGRNVWMRRIGRRIEAPLRSLPVMSCPRLPVSARAFAPISLLPNWGCGQSADLMLKAPLRFRPLANSVRGPSASIDGVGTDMKVQVRQFPATFDFGRIPLSGASPRSGGQAWRRADRVGLSRLLHGGKRNLRESPAQTERV